MKNIVSMRSKGVNWYPSALHSYLFAKFEVLMCYSYWVSLLQPDYEDNEEEEQHGKFLLQISHTLYIT